ncbi:MAG TPA: HAMP domain-containing sensor histidine kinase [Candidatus Nanoarchaeia archaeon]|nr:HAMP domain-containing sensor histidine kinase [Candidatus Nanoarchaeia archaeon]
MGKTKCLTTKVIIDDIKEQEGYKGLVQLLIGIEGFPGYEPHITYGAERIVTKPEIKDLASEKELKKILASEKFLTDPNNRVSMEVQREMLRRTKVILNDPEAPYNIFVRGGERGDRVGAFGTIAKAIVKTAGYKGLVHAGAHLVNFWNDIFRDSARDMSDVQIEYIHAYKKPLEDTPNHLNCEVMRGIMTVSARNAGPDQPLFLVREVECAEYNGSYTKYIIEVPPSKTIFMKIFPYRIVDPDRIREEEREKYKEVIDEERTALERQIEDLTRTKDDLITKRVEAEREKQRAESAEALAVQRLEQLVELHSREEQILSMLRHNLLTARGQIYGEDENIERCLDGASASIGALNGVLKEANLPLDRLKELNGYLKGIDQGIGGLKSVAGRIESIGLAMKNLSEAFTVKEPYRKIEIEGMVNGFKASYESDKVKVAVEIQPGVEFNGDDIHYQGIFENLISNAVRYAKDVVHVRLYKDNDGKVIEVSDNGTGTDKPLEELVKPLTSEARGTGHGLGLWSVRQFAELYGGKLIMEGKNTYGGATFRVEFPVQDKGI